MIKCFLTALCITLASSTVYARTQIDFLWPYSTSHGATPAIFPLIEEANKIQDKYEFVFESKPGASSIIAISHMNNKPNERITVVAPEFVELVVQGRVQESDYAFLSGLGDMCFAVWMKDADPVKGFDSIKNQGEIVVGNVGWGNASHLIALTVADKYNMKVKNVVFRSNREGLINLAQGGAVTLVVDKTDAFDDMRSQAKVQAWPAAVTCSQRVKAWPNTKTLAEQGIPARAPWLMVIANKSMPVEEQQEIADALNKAMIKVGPEKAMELGNLTPVVFQKNKNVNDWYNERATTQKTLLKKYQATIDAARGATTK